MTMVRLTTAQALVRFLDRQYVEVDGETTKFVAGVMAIFGHGNVTGLGEALENEEHGLRFVRGNNEQGMVHAATAFAKQRRRRAIFACTSSIGPGATNLVTGAATATINRLPVLLLPGDVFADRQPDPVLQQLEHPAAADVSVNDCLRPVSRYFDRVWRPEQLATALLNAFRVLTDPAQTGAVTLALPQDVQAESGEFPEELLAPRVWRIGRRSPEGERVSAAAELLRGARRPLVVAGGGVHYAGAVTRLREFAEAHGVPVAETQAGKGALLWEHAMSVGGVGVTGTAAANRLARDADAVLFVGSRLTDFTTASKSFFGEPRQRRIHLNVEPADAAKLDALPLVADARTGLEALDGALAGWQSPDAHRATVAAERAAWQAEVERLYALAPRGEELPQTAVLGRLERFLGPLSVVVCAAGSLPGDLHRLWRPASDVAYHLEYGTSCMGYEIAGALGVKLAAPESEVWAVVGDGSFLMLHSELVTALQEGVKIDVLLLDNRGFQCIRSLARAQGGSGFGTELRRRDAAGRPDAGETLEIDFAGLAAALGVAAFRARSLAELDSALAAARREPRATLVEVKVDRDSMSGSYEAAWRVGVAEQSRRAETAAAGRDMRARFSRARRY